ncbi:MAG: DUF2911 domain-containing protein [Acidobacteriota bacterium]
MRRFPLTLTAVALAATSAHADIELPRVSPPASVSLTIGTTDVEISYHRPAVKGRAVWGELVPFDQVWRLGANDATTIAISDAATIAGKVVPAGEYALFAIPGKSTWTVILNSRPKQWGAFYYKPAEDLVRFEVVPETSEFQEWMSFSIEPKGPNVAEVAMRWERVTVAFPIEVDVPGIVWKDILGELAETDADGDDYLFAATYSLQQGGHREESLVWADRAVALKPGFWTFETRARLLHREGRVSEALASLDQAVADARGKTPQAYIDGLLKIREEWSAPASR